MENAVALGHYHPNCSNLSPTVASDVTVFCDFDGPIVDVSDRYYSTYQLALAEIQTRYQSGGVTLPIHMLNKMQFWQMKQDRIPDLEIAMRSGLCHKQVDLFLQHVSHLVNQPILLSQDRLQPGVEWALTLLRTQGIRLVLVTLRCQAQARQMLQCYGLAHLFSDIIGTQEHDAAYLNYAEHKAQLLTDAITKLPQLEQGLKLGRSRAQSTYSARSPRAWMIGDTEADILAGQAMSIPTIALTCGIRSRSYLERFAPTRIHSDLLSAAHYLMSQNSVQYAAQI